MSAFQLERLYGRFHSLDDRRLGARLVDMLVLEADGTPWWALVLRRDGQFHIAADPRVGVDLAPPDGDKRAFARDLAIKLNRELHDGGAWVVFWCEGFDNWARLAQLWKDPDGDKKLVTETDDAWPRVRRAGVDKWAADCATALANLALVETQMLQVRPDQQVRAALGERARA